MQRTYKDKIDALARNVAQEKKKLSNLQEQRQFVIDTLIRRVTEIRKQLHLLQLEARAFLLMRDDVMYGLPAVFALEPPPREDSPCQVSTSGSHASHKKKHAEAAKGDTRIRAKSRKEKLLT